MFTPRAYRIWIPGLSLAICAAFLTICQWRLAAQPAPAGAAHGPDVIVGDIPNVTRWGSLGSETAFSIATTSCNIGDLPLDWIASPASNLHPVITQNLYRIQDGAIQQLGTVSWLKHGFSVVPGTVCGSCMDGSHNRLGIHCSDPYGAGLNGLQEGLGPRREINAATGAFGNAFARLPQPRTILDGRMRVANADLDPSVNPTARYFVESQYIHPQDAVAGNGLNNASHREAFIETRAGGELHLALRPSSPIVRQQPAILAWKTIHSDVTLHNFDIPGDGRIMLGIRSIPLIAGGFKNLIALQNLNSDASVRSLSIDFGDGNVANAGFHDIDYQHEPYSATDWPATIASSKIEWSTDTLAMNRDANALRWGTMYSFSCDSGARPKRIQIGLFKQGAADPQPFEFGDADNAHALAAADEGASWALVEQNIDLGTILPQSADKFGVTVHPGRQCSIVSVESGSDQLSAELEKDEKSKPGSYVVKLAASKSAKSGYFEAILTLEPSGAEKPAQIRVYGVIAE
jgi:hypothetical protein